VDVIGIPFREAFREFGESATALFDTVLSTQERFVATELRVTDSATGAERFFNFICQPLQDYRGPLLLTHAVEVTEQVHARREVEEALRVRDEFISIASHELKTPIAVLQGQAQLMLRRLERAAPLDAERITLAFETIVRQAGKLSRLVGQLLDVSRLQAAKLTIEREPTDLVALVQQVVATARNLSDQHPITLTAPASLQTDVDPLRLEQVLTNLLDNAVKYSPDGGPIEVAVWEPEPGVAELSVRDHGLGIPPGTRGEIFERFYQAHGSGNRSGLGLGLYICRQIVELHGGQIRAEFPEDGGTQMIVRLPLHPPAEQLSGD
jgi:signal transduction histidine kinase